MAFQQNQAADANEYAIYTFGASQTGKSARMWEKKASHAAKGAAIRQAEDLYRTGQYARIEIKQKYFDSRKNRNVDLTLKTLGRKDKRYFRTAAVVLAAAICGVAAFGMTYFLGHGG